MSRRLLRHLSRWMIGALLLSQMLIAAYACPSLTAAASNPQQFGPELADADDARVAPARDVEISATAAAFDPAAPNLCAEHCKAGQQSDQVAHVVVQTPLPALLYFRIATALAPPPARPSSDTLDALAASAPPHAILHCVRRT